MLSARQPPLGSIYNPIAAGCGGGGGDWEGGGCGGSSGGVDVVFLLWGW